MCVITRITDGLSVFNSNAASHARAKLNEIGSNWSNMNSGEQTQLTRVLNAMDENLPMFSKLGSNPLGAIKSAINLGGVVASIFGPTQLLGAGFILVAEMLGLFGQGQDPESIGNVVKKQIDNLCSFSFKYS